MRTVLPFAGREAGDGLEVLRGGRRQAHGHLVDDLGVEDVLDVLDAAEDRPRDHRSPLARRGQVADDLHPQPGVALDAVGEVLGEAARPGDQHESRVVALAPDGLEHVAQDDPAGERDRRLRDEQEGQEQAADVLLLEDEERRQRERQHDEGRAGNVPRLGPQAPADAQPVQPHRPQRDDPGEARRARRRDGCRSPPRATGPLGLRRGSAGTTRARKTRTALRPSPSMRATRSAMR